jgi:hypothetical protein
MSGPMNVTSSCSTASYAVERYYPFVTFQNVDMNHADTFSVMLTVMRAHFAP